MACPWPEGDRCQILILPCEALDRDPRPAGIGGAAIKGHIKEYQRVRGQRADHAELVTQPHETVFDAVVEARSQHLLAFAANDFGIGGSRSVDVELRRSFF